jgi:hypothetical protein
VFVYRVRVPPPFFFFFFFLGGGGSSRINTHGGLVARIPGLSNRSVQSAASCFQLPSLPQCLKGPSCNLASCLIYLRFWFCLTAQASLSIAVLFASYIAQQRFRPFVAAVTLSTGLQVGAFRKAEEGACL